MYSIAKRLGETNGTRIALVSVAMLAVVLLAVTGTAGAVEVSSCTTIDANNAPNDGNVTLTGDITNSTAPSCLNVTVSNVTVFGQGHTIDSISDGSVSGTNGTGVRVFNASTTLTNVTVRNVTVTEWLHAVEYDDVSGGNITGVNATENGLQIITRSTADGISVVGNTVNDTVFTNGGIQIDGTNSVVRDNVLDQNYNSVELGGNGNIVEDNVILNGLGSGSILLTNANDNIVRNNDVDSSRAVAVNGVNNTIRGNTIDGSSYFGIEISNAIDSQNRVINNSLTGGTGNAIQVIDTSDVLLRDNDITGAGANGTLIDNADNVTLENNNINSSADNGVSVNNTSLVNITGGVIDETTNDNGIEVTGSSDNVTIDGVTVTNTGFAGINANSANSTINGNTVTQTFYAAIWGGEGANVTNNVVRDSGTDGILGGGRVVGNDIDGTDEVGILAPASVVRDNTVNNTDRTGTAGSAILVDADGTDVINNTVTNANTNGTLVVGANSNFEENTYRNVGESAVVVDGSAGATLTNTTVRGATDAFEAVNAGEATATGFDIGDSTNANTTLDFDAQDVRLAAEPSPPGDPSGEQNIGRYASATNTAATAFFNVTFRYNDGDVSSVNESSLDVWRNDGAWNELTGTTVNEADNEVQRNLTATDLGGVFAPLAGERAAINSTVSDGGVPSNITVGDSVQPVENTTVTNIDDSTIKLYYNVTPLSEHNVGLDSLNVANFTATNGSAGQTTVNNNSGVVVTILTVEQLGGVNTTDVSFNLTQLGTSSANPATGITYDVNVSEGTSTDSRFDASNGNAPGADDQQTQPFSILANPSDGPGNFTVNITGTNSPVGEGDDITVTANITNTGSGADTQEVSLNVPGVGNDNASVGLGSGSSTTEMLAVGTGSGDAGSYTATVDSDNDTDTAPVVVQAPANFTVDVTGTNQPVREGENLTVDINVTNTGDVSSTQNVTLDIDGAERDSVLLSLGAGVSATDSLSWSTQAGDAGSYTATVASGNDSETVSVTIGSTSRRDLGRGEEDQQPPRDRDLGRGDDRVEDRRSQGR